MSKKPCTLNVSRPTKKLIKHLLRRKIHFVLQRKNYWDGQWDSTIHSKSKMPKHPKTLYAEKFAPGSFDGEIGRSFSCKRPKKRRKMSCSHAIFAHNRHKRICAA
jgi:hypothetical protein